MSGPTLVLVHGGWHRPSSWDRLQAELHDIRTVAVALPSAGPDPAALGTSTDDASAVESAVAAVDGPVVVVAHSYGGVPVTQVAGRLPNVVGVVYVAAWVLDIGESPLSIAGSDGPPTWWDLHPAEGYFDALHPEEIFYNDVDPSTAADYAGRLVHQSLDLGTPLTDAAWRHLPTSYVLCEQDAAIPVAAQEAMSARTGRVHRLRSGHCPFVSRPAELAAILRSEATAFTAQANVEEANR